jgi:hypothetical protein
VLRDSYSKYEQLSLSVLCQLYKYVDILFTTTTFIDLEEVHLDYVPVRDESVTTLSECCRNIQTLSLLGCEVTDTSLLKTVTDLANLSSIMIGYNIKLTPGVTTQMLNLLSKMLLILFNASKVHYQLH